jgi:hypothetical protein
VLVWLGATVQVDDLEDISDLEGYIDRTVCILVYCSKGYFTSKNCIRELVATVYKSKKIIPLIDLDQSRGGMTTEQVHDQLLDADNAFEKWGFQCPQTRKRKSLEWHGPYVWPSGQSLYNALFANESIEWNRERHKASIHCSRNACP